MASHVRAERVRTIRHGEELPKKKGMPSLGELANRYFEEKGPTLKGLATDKARWNLHLAPSLEHKTVQQIAPLDVEFIRNKLQRGGKAPGTIKNVLSLLKRIAFR